MEPLVDKLKEAEVKKRSRAFVSKYKKRAPIQQAL
jgi:hypothetical protein